MVTPPTVTMILPPFPPFLPSSPAHLGLRRAYLDERDLPIVSHLIDNELSEPYSIFTYRYFLKQWPHLCFLALDEERCFGVIVCKQEPHKNGMNRGYIAMLVVENEYRGLGVGSQLVRTAIEAMRVAHADEVSLEAEVSNTAAIALYEGLGFTRDKRLHAYYMSNQDAFRLKLLLPPPPQEEEEEEEVGPLRADLGAVHI